jgi:hypothetical protein
MDGNDLPGMWSARLPLAHFLLLGLSLALYQTLYKQTSALSLALLPVSLDPDLVILHLIT